MAYSLDNVTLDNGQVIVNGATVGSLNKELRYGYHPAACLTIGAHTEWFELDQADLMTAIVNKVKSILKVVN